MSINSRMISTKVFELNETVSLSGAKKLSWIERKDKINVSIYQASQFVSKEKYRHTETTHNAVTYAKFLKANKFRLVQDNKKYEVLDVDNSNRMAQVSLKEVEIW